MNTNPRQLQLLDEVRSRQSTSVEQLAEILGVTLQTVRRDIQKLADAGLMVRFHGGVRVPSATVENLGHTQRQVLHAEGKSRIARAVAEAIPNGCSLILNIGTTTEAVAQALLKQVIAWREVSAWLSDASAGDANLIGASAYDYLMLSGYTLLGYLWLRAACVAERALAAGSDEAAFYQGKRETARFYLQRLLPRANLHETLIRTGSNNLMDISEAAFAR